MIKKEYELSCSLKLHAKLRIIVSVYTIIRLCVLFMDGYM